MSPSVPAEDASVFIYAVDQEVQSLALEPEGLHHSSMFELFFESWPR
jgi:hypothetical protein